MAKGSFTITATFDVKPEKIYSAYLDGKTHAAFTGSPAKIENKVGGKFMAWDGYINGKIVKLVKNEKIVQTWRTTEFEEEDKDSMLEITLTEEKVKTKLTMKHTDLPSGSEKEYKQGWKDFYFEPMRKFFGAR